jgi:hypothetical protein
MNSKSLTLSALLIVLITNFIWGQTQPPVTYTSPIAVGPAPVFGRQSGTDIYEFQSALYRVFVNDDDSLMYWYVDTNGTPYSGGAAFDSQIMSDPDVTLVALNNKVYAVVAYHNVGAGFYCTIFNYSAGVFSKVNTNALLTGSYPNSCSINIDGDTYGNFVITWDNGAGDIYIATGDLPNLITNKFNLYSNANYKWPDIALFNNGSTNIATLSYVSGTNTIAVEQHTYSNLVLGTSTAVSPSPFSLTGITSQSMAYQPRVAVPPPAGNSNEWTVVAVNENSSTMSNIIGWTYNSGTLSGMHDYTNSINWNSMDKVYNYYPSVTYDNTYPSGSFPIWIGWTMANNLSPNIAGFYTADYVMVMPCSPAGVEYGDLYEVQTQSNGDYSEALSLAGCQTCSSLLTYWEDYYLSGWVRQFNYLEILNPSSCTTSFRPSNDSIDKDLKSKITVELYSMHGNLIYKSIVEDGELSKYLKLHNQLSGFYVLIVYNSNGQRVARKITFNN